MLVKFTISNAEFINIKSKVIISNVFIIIVIVTKTTCSKLGLIITLSMRILSIMIISIIILRVMTLGIMIFGIMILSMMTLSLMTSTILIL